MFQENYSFQFADQINQTTYIIIKITIYSPQSQNFCVQPNSYMINLPFILKNSQSFSPGLGKKPDATKVNQSSKYSKLNNQTKHPGEYMPAYIKHRKQKNMSNFYKKKVDPQQEYQALAKQEKSIVTQIRDINIVIQNQRNKNFKTSLFGNYIFLKDVDSMVIDKFYECLKIQSQASNAIVQGFNFSTSKLNQDGGAQLLKRSIINSVKPISKKLLEKSIANIQIYDHSKNYEYEHEYGKQWSIVKRKIHEQNQNQESLQSELISQKVGGRSIVKRRTVSDKNASRSTRLFQSKLSQFQKKSEINQSSFLNKLINSKITKNTRTKTEPIPQQKESQQFKITKKDVKSIILKNKKNMISIWLPPSSYPQFFALFTYKIVKKQTQNVYKCRIMRYFFYKYNLNQQTFSAILEWATQETGHYIQILQMTIQKELFVRQLSKQGWTMKYWESASKIRIQLNRKGFSE